MGLLSSSITKLNSRKVDFAIKHTGLTYFQTHDLCYFIHNNGERIGDIFPSSFIDVLGIKEWIQLAEDTIDKAKNDIKKNKPRYTEV